MFFHVILCEQIYKLYLKKQNFKTDFYSKIKFVYRYNHYKKECFIYLTKIKSFVYLPVCL